MKLVRHINIVEYIAYLFIILALVEVVYVALNFTGILNENLNNLYYIESTIDVVSKLIVSYLIFKKSSMTIFFIGIYFLVSILYITYSSVSMHDKIDIMYVAIVAIVYFSLFLIIISKRGLEFLNIRLKYARIPREVVTFLLGLSGLIFLSIIINNLVALFFSGVIYYHLRKRLV
ncbi:hypothetical protein JYT31_02320 [Beggiatoa alba]|nr:hypothetical protein [Beggiatoa alba]